MIRDLLVDILEQITLYGHGDWSHKSHNASAVDKGIGGAMLAILATDSQKGSRKLK